MSRTYEHFRKDLEDDEDTERSRRHEAEKEQYLEEGHNDNEVPSSEADLFRWIQQRES
jgi:hypothetical protein